MSSDQLAIEFAVYLAGSESVSNRKMLGIATRVLGEPPVIDDDDDDDDDDYLYFEYSSEQSFGRRRFMVKDGFWNLRRDGNRKDGPWTLYYTIKEKRGDAYVSTVFDGSKLGPLGVDAAKIAGDMGFTPSDGRVLVNVWYNGSDRPPEKPV